MSLDQAANAKSPLARRLLVHQWREAQVRANIGSCNECQLGVSNRVPFTGSTWQPDLILIGEAPGANEDRQRTPFVGRAGRLLDEMLVRAGTSRMHCVITNCVCCRPPSNRDPEWSELMACEPNRLSQIALAQTVVGVSMGRVALSVLKKDPGVRIGINRSKPFWADDKIWIPTYHPAYALRNSHAVSMITADIKLAMDIKNGKESMPVHPDWPEWEQKQGNIVIRDESVTLPTNVEALGPIWTQEEWAKMRYQTKMAREVVNHLKNAFEATVVK